LSVTFIGYGQALDEAKSFSLQHLLKVLKFLRVGVPECCHLIVSITPGQFKCRVRIGIFSTELLHLRSNGILPSIGRLIRDRSHLDVLWLHRTSVVHHEGKDFAGADGSPCIFLIISSNDETLIDKVQNILPWEV
jgi:hypothetical protein